MNNTKDEIQHSHNHKDNWLEYLWKALGDERNYRRLDVLVKIIGGLGVSLVIFFVGQYVQKQSYYSSLLDKYLVSTEQLLIKDNLEWRKEMRDQQGSSSSAKPTPEEIKSSIDSLLRANTEQTIRSLSEDDGLGGIMGFINHGPTWLNHNIERRQLLINFLRNSRLGFKNEKGEETNGAFSPLLTGLDLSEVGKDCRSKSPSPGCGLDLQEVDLSRAILPKAVLTQTNLRGAILSDADLRGATLTQAHLGGAFLSQANLEGAFLPEANLKGADLRKADLTGADLTGADLTGADLTGADLTGAKGAELKGAKLCKTIGPDQIQNDRDCPPGAN
jgi:uncharacterized protein YjbI with pentapeptide repeats